MLKYFNEINYSILMTEYICEPANGLNGDSGAGAANATCIKAPKQAMIAKNFILFKLSLKHWLDALMQLPATTPAFIQFVLRTILFLFQFFGTRNQV